MAKLVMWDASQHLNFSDALDSGAVYDVRGVNLEVILTYDDQHLSALWNMEDYFASFCEMMGKKREELEIGMQAKSYGFEMYLPLNELLDQREKAIALENQRAAAKIKANQ